MAFVLAVSVFQGCGASEPARSEQDDEPQVELFGPGVVSTELPEFAVSFSVSGDTVFFNRTPPDRSRLDLLYATKVGDGWSEAEPFGPLADVAAIDPFVSLDGSFLYFSSGLPREGGLEGSFNLWRLPLNRPGALPEALPEPINTDSSEVFNSIARDGTMVFSSRRDGERRVYEVRLGGSGGAEPVRLDLGTGEPASNPALHPSGDLLVFARASADGPPDLFVACREGGEWGPPRRLPEPINSDFTDFAPGFGADHLYFTSERPGMVGPLPQGERPPGDIYRTPVERIEVVCFGDEEGR